MEDQSMTSLVGSTLFILLVGALPLLIFFLVQRKRRLMMKELASALGGRYVFGLFAPSVKIERGGRPIKIWTRPRQRYSPARLVIEQKGGMGCSLIVDPKKSALTRNYRIFAPKPMPIGDPELEMKYIIRTDDQARVGFMLRDREYKDCLEQFFTVHGFSSLVASGKKLALLKLNFQNEDLSPEVMTPTIEAVTKLTGA